MATFHWIGTIGTALPQLAVTFVIFFVFNALILFGPLLIANLVSWAAQWAPPAAAAGKPILIDATPGARTATLSLAGTSRRPICAAPRAPVKGYCCDWFKSTITSEVSRLAIATSGRYERGEHIVVPWTARPPSGLMAVTVVGTELALADGYATAAVVLGAEGMRWLASVPDVEGIGITDDHQVVATPGFERYRAA